MIRRRIEEKRFDDLLRGPLGARMCRHIETHDVSAAVFKDNEDVKNPEAGHGYCNEIDLLA